MMPEQNCSFSLAWRTYTPGFTRKLEQKFVSAIITTNSGKSLFQVTTSQITSNYLTNYRSEKTILFFKFFRVWFFEVIIIPVEYLPQPSVSHGIKWNTLPGEAFGSLGWYTLRMVMIKPEKHRNDSHHYEGIHMFTILFEIKSEKQIKSGKLSNYRPRDAL